MATTDRIRELLLRARDLEQEAAKRAGLDPDLRQHDLRHLWVTLSLADGVPLANVRDAAGHADYATTEMYANMNPDQYLAGFEQRYGVEPQAAVQYG